MYGTSGDNIGERDVPVGRTPCATTKPVQTNSEKQQYEYLSNLKEHTHTHAHICTRIFLLSRLQIIIPTSCYKQRQYKWFVVDGSLSLYVFLFV